jgi:ABC-type glycerol-3-phosphate transport system substrate-binding protein
VSGWLPTSATPAQLTNYKSNWNPKVKITAKYTDPAFVNVLTRMKQLNDQGYYQDGFLGMTGDQANAVFSSGKAGMVFGGSFVSGLRQPGIDLGWALMPPMTAGRTSQLTVFSDTIAIPIHSKHIALAKKFLAYYMSKEAQSAVASAGVNLPAVNDVPESAMAQIDPIMREELVSAKKNGVQNGWTAVVAGAVGGEALNPDVQEMYLGKLDPTTIAERRQSALVKFRTGK